MTFPRDLAKVGEGIRASLDVSGSAATIYQNIETITNGNVSSSLEVIESVLLRSEALNATEVELAEVMNTKVDAVFIRDNSNTMITTRGFFTWSGRDYRISTQTYDPVLHHIRILATFQSSNNPV